MDGFYKLLKMGKKILLNRGGTWRKALLLVCLLPAGYLYLRVIGCPIRFLTGVSCAGCGMTRAWMSVLRLDFAAAYRYHPLFPLPAAAVALYALRGRLRPAFLKGCLYAGALLFLAVYLWRMLYGDGSVVAFEPQQGLIFQIFFKT